MSKRTLLLSDKALMWTLKAEDTIDNKLACLFGKVIGNSSRTICYSITLVENLATSYHAKFNSRCTLSRIDLGTPFLYTLTT